MTKKLWLNPAVLTVAIIALAACSSESTRQQSNLNPWQPSPMSAINSSSTPSPFKTATPTPTALPAATPLTRPGDEAKLHVENVKKVPVAARQEDFYELDDAIGKNDDAKALRMIRSGKVSMVENDSSIVVIEPNLYLSKIKVKQSGRVGWVKSSWIFGSTQKVMLGL
jgi:hypothetical protein